MATQQEQTLKVYEQLRPGDRVQLEHEVKVGFKSWDTVTVGKVLRCERRRHGLHRQRNPDDKVFSDMIVLEKDGGEITTVTLDEFSVLRKIDGYRFPLPRSSFVHSLRGSASQRPAVAAPAASKAFRARAARRLLE